MIHIVGAGSGAADLITLRGARLLRAADVVVWAGSLVNPELLAECKESCVVYDSAHMTLEEVLDVMCAADARGEEVVRLHTGDPCLYGAIQEQMDALDARGVVYEVVKLTRVPSISKNNAFIFLSIPISSIPNYIYNAKSAL